MPLRNIPPTPHGAPVGTPLEELAASIRHAANVNGWQVIGSAPGSVMASLRVRNRHHCIVRIGFDETSYWIDYVDSENLDYSEKDLRLPGPRGRVVKGPRIHRNDNRWVASLAKAIEIGARMPVPVSRPTRASSPPLIADELEKLDSLRQRGVLTQEEFDQQKKKLLAR